MRKRAIFRPYGRAGCRAGVRGQGLGWRSTEGPGTGSGSAVFEGFEVSQALASGCWYVSQRAACVIAERLLPKRPVDLRCCRDDGSGALGRPFLTGMSDQARWATATSTHTGTVFMDDGHGMKHGGESVSGWGAGRRSTHFPSGRNSHDEGGRHGGCGRLSPARRDAGAVDARWPASGFVTNRDSGCGGGRCRFSVALLGLHLAQRGPTAR